jgi:hypothetical protein
MKTQAPCNECGGERNHEVLFTTKTNLTIMTIRAIMYMRDIMALAACCPGFSMGTGKPPSPLAPLPKGEGRYFDTGVENHD